MDHQTIDFGILPEQVGFNLRRAYFVTTQLFAEAFADIGITPIQFAILEVVSRNNFLPQQEIATHIGTTPSVVVKPIRKLETMGLVQRSRSEQDRRNHYLHLTDAGKKLQIQARNCIREVENELLKNLSANERQILLTLLQKIIQQTEST